MTLLFVLHILYQVCYYFLENSFPWGGEEWIHSLMTLHDQMKITLVSRVKSPWVSKSESCSCKVLLRCTRSESIMESWENCRSLKFHFKVLSITLSAVSMATERNMKPACFYLCPISRPKRAGGLSGFRCRVGGNLLFFLFLLWISCLSLSSLCDYSTCAAHSASISALLVSRRFQ